MTDLSLEHNRATLTIDESEGGIVIKVAEKDRHAQIWLDNRATHKLCQYLKDFLSQEDDYETDDLH